LADVAKNRKNIGPLGLADQMDAQLFARAQFTPDEVKNLRTQFEQMDFVRSAPLSPQNLVDQVVPPSYSFPLVNCRFRKPINPEPVLSG